MNISCNNVNFTGAQVSKKGLDIVMQRPIDHVKEVINTLKKAENSATTDFIINDVGNYYVRTPEYGTIRVDNPSCPSVCGSRLCLNVEDIKGKGRKIGIDFPSKKEAEKIADNFAPGAYMPALNIDLFNAIEAEIAYKNTLRSSLEAFAE